MVEAKTVQQKSWGGKKQGTNKFKSDAELQQLPFRHPTKVRSSHLFLHTSPENSSCNFSFLMVASGKEEA